MSRAKSNRIKVGDLLDNYPVVLDVCVAWGDMDALGHVNNARYFSYFESARLAYFDQIGFMSMMAKTGVDKSGAEEALASADGFLARALGERE